MSYTEPDEFEDKEVSLVYIAGEVGEVGGVEKLLTEKEINYTVSNVPFLREMLFEGAVELPGVGFYVLSGQAEYCRKKYLLSEGFKTGIVMDGEE